MFNVQCSVDAYHLYRHPANAEKGLDNFALINKSQNRQGLSEVSGPMGALSETY